VLRHVLAADPNRDDRAAACYWLARYLQGQARSVRRLRERPGDRKDFEKHKAATPVGPLVREKDDRAQLDLARGSRGEDRLHPAVPHQGQQLEVVRGRVRGVGGQIDPGPELPADVVHAAVVVGVVVRSRPHQDHWVAALP
jgi:hypothetical protein